eukprot:TRINITY_DN4504_c0_g1_i4.p1 TRINITY_DN4504_c0_g1~~TRINITY_DN4504_c0_g1_i4.p1  ORF type:complete len:401 (+),score=69.52 TRINITY_DN4504_c0_g1_i4:616-1818(+)
MISRGSLSTYLRTFKYPRLSVCQLWFTQILEGLGYLHSHGIVHGYICCDNIYINSNTGELKIGNLCVAKLPEVASNKAVYKSAQEDVRRFGLLALEVILAQVLAPSKLKKIMQRLYDPATFDKKRLLKLTKHITDDDYKVLVETCMCTDTSVTVKDIQQLKFFTATRGKSETLRGMIKKSVNAKDAIKKPNSRFRLIVIQNTLKTCPTLETHLINIQVKIVNSQTSCSITFSYNILYDTPESISQEMRESLSLSEEYILAIQTQIQVAVQDYLSNLSKNIGYPYGGAEYKPDIGNRSEMQSEYFARESRHRALHPTSRQPSISESISPIDTSSVASICTSNTVLEHLKAIARRYLPPPPPKMVIEREEALQPEVAFSDVQITPRNDGEDETISIDKYTKK